MDPALEILQKVVAALKADAGIAAVVGDKVFDRPPHKDGEPDVESPYISLGPNDTTTDELADCLDNVTITFQVDGWSWGGGEAYSRSQVSKMAGAMRRILHRLELPMSEGRDAQIYHRQTRILRDPDGTNHAALTFEAMASGGA